MKFLFNRLATVFVILAIAILAGYFIEPLIGLLIFISVCLFFTVLNAIGWYKQASARNKPLALMISGFFLLVAITIIYNWAAIISSS